MTIATTNPATGETVRTFSAHSASDVDARVARAHETFQRWSRTPLADRVKVVSRAAELLDARKDDYGRLMTLEMGKLLVAAREEAAKCATGCRYYARHAAAILADESVVREGE